MRPAWLAVAVRWSGRSDRSRELVWFGTLVRQSRFRAGWSQRDLASAAGINQSTVSRIENALIPGLRLDIAVRILWLLRPTLA